jgi:glycosyltransferase involved in cell wall biosynthesis
MHMPDKYLIILYNPNDSEKQVLMNMARGCNNIFFHHEGADIGMAKIIANSVATISLTRDENFSLVSIESMACGVPMISIDDGAVRESITHEKTGVLLPKDFTIYDTIKAVTDMSPAKSLSMKDACIERTKDFSLERFSLELKSHMG